MKHHHLLATFALTLAVGACVEPADPVTTEAAEATTLFCMPNEFASAPLPPPKTWQNALPPDQGNDQVWITVPTDATMQKYRMYQVNKQNKTVTWWTELTDQQRPYATYLSAQRPGSYVSIRNPPPPPWPPGDDWTTAHRLVNEAFHYVGSHF